MQKWRAKRLQTFKTALSLSFVQFLKAFSHQLSRRRTAGLVALSFDK